MLAIQELQILREELIQQIDDKISKIIQILENETHHSGQQEENSEIVFESIYPLHAGTGIFKGKRPTGVIFADGTREDVPTWKKLFEKILEHCNQDPEKHKALMDLRGKLLGRNRVLLGSEKGNMRSPIKIDRALYVETHYDTETLLKILTTRILSAVGYDYSEICIAIQNN